MKSLSSTKTKRMSVPGVYRNKVFPWHTAQIPQKHKKLFGIPKKVYVSEYNSVFKKKVLYSNKQISFEKSAKFRLIENKTSQITHLLESSFWGFRHPMAVPGAVQMKRYKNHYKTYKKELSNILLWFGGMNLNTFLSLCKEAFYWNKLHQNTSFALFFDSLLPNLLLKSGFHKNFYTAKNSVLNGAHPQAFIGNPEQIKQKWSAFNNTNMFFVKKMFYAKNQYSFQKGCYKSLNISIFFIVILIVSLFYLFR